MIAIFCIFGIFAAVYSLLFVRPSMIGWPMTIWCFVIWLFWIAGCTYGFYYSIHS